MLLWVGVLVLLVVEVGGLSCEGVHLARVDLSGGCVIDEVEGGAVVVGDGLAGGGLNGVPDFGTSVVVAQHVDVAVVEAGEDDGLGVHHGGDEAEEFRLESGMEDFEVGFHGLAAESALCGVLQLAHVAGAVDVVEAFAVHHCDVAFEDGEVFVGVSVGRQLRKGGDIVLEGDIDVFHAGHVVAAVGSFIKVFQFECADYFFGHSDWILRG